MRNVLFCFLLVANILREFGVAAMFYYLEMVWLTPDKTISKVLLEKVYQI